MVNVKLLIYCILIFIVSSGVYFTLLNYTDTHIKNVEVECRDGQGNIMDVDYKCYDERLDLDLFGTMICILIAFTSVLGGLASLLIGCLVVIGLID